MGSWPRRLCARSRHHGTRLSPSRRGWSWRARRLSLWTSTSPLASFSRWPLLKKSQLSLSWSRPDELPQRTALGNEFGELIERIDLPVGRLQYPLEVSWPMREAPAIDDRDYLPPPLPLGTFILVAAQRLEA